ncbi:N-acetylmuramoyl-L-alanine amidase [Halalkalibacterium halodurans]|uniref:N-acetylmuramoyl-L-alanine amidase n=1 Tax=Halalkalibacterium halodurans TaxID=86665 RepID=UPI002AA9C3AA|nr:N-acetylmuramoyl-L-alanine amidase [Halalkalibacterium halodurans]MDY7222096.1 N-acetylmuramoyl-L-alanine amidase [Halalkalibacterium halodurans]MDY7243885.1 N-acetylmuramoyl-L-alanine amidase [Halalkalibacterium halodurans]
MKFFLDPGHGGRDPGAVANGVQEKDIALSVALAIKKFLEENFDNVEVKLSREDDRFLSLSERARLANAWGADYFVSIHCNAGGGTGFETFIHDSRSTKSVAYQNVVHPAILDKMGVRDRGKKAANFAVLRLTNMPAILTENLFVDNARDAALLKDPAFLQQVARGHVEGIAKAFGLKRKGGATSKPTGIQPSKPAANKTTTSQPKQSKSGDQVVRAIQEFINTYGFNIAVDGIAGPQTMRGLVRVLQTELNKQFGRGLVVDGIFGPRTRAALVNVRAGARGNLTRVLQALLYIRGFNPGQIDSIFGGKTESAVRKFQRDNGLTVDGIVGPKTWAALLG